MSNQTPSVEVRSHTRAPWTASGCGGHSVVLSSVEPSRNDSRIPEYGYTFELLFSIGYPFLDERGRARHDFVCFSHEDARLIAAAPELLEAAKRVLAASDPDIPGSPGSPLEMLRDAIDKAEKQSFLCSKCKHRYVSVEARNKHCEKCDGK